MQFLVVDDVRLIAGEEAALLREIMPQSRVFSCTGAKEALEIARRETLHAAFLDIELGSMNGIALAKALKDIQPLIHIVFVTSFAHYAVEAFSIHATGYLLKPVQKEQLERELRFLYGEELAKKRVRVQTFGSFAVWVDGAPLPFGRAKAKELFAYLVSRQGAAVSTREACAILFEDGDYNRSMKSYYQTIVADMRNSLKKAGAGEVICKAYNSIAVNADMLECDYYRFLEGDARAVNSYRGEFMSNYSWAEFSAAALSGNFVLK